MTARARARTMLMAAAALFALIVWGAVGLPDFGHYVGPYGDVIARSVVPERHVTGVVSAIVFDYRGIDTLGEEFILFVSVLGVSLLLREQRGEPGEPAQEAAQVERLPASSDAVRVLGVMLIGALVVVGLYIVAHGQLTPGGGFQGGVILGAAVILVYFAGEFVAASVLRPASWMEHAHAGGAAGLALLGVGGMLAGGAYLHNFVSKGTTGMLLSGGTIPLGNVAVGLEVFGAMLLLASEFLEESVGQRS